MTTSPQNTPENLTGSGYEPLVAQAAAPAPTLVAEWRRLGTFLKRPSLDVGTQNAQPFVVLGRIYALDMAIMLVLVSMAGLAMALGVELPETALAGMEFTPTLIALVVLGAPLMEEMMFRSWLSGRPAIIVPLAIIAGALLVGNLTGFVRTESDVLMLASGAILAALIALVVLWRRPTMRWFAAIFPLFYWLTVLSFALVHLANFEEGGAVLLALVLPQFVLGTLLGYVRVRIGLWAAMVLHGAHNATALGIASLAMGAG